MIRPGSLAAAVVVSVLAPAGSAAAAADRTPPVITPRYVGTVGAAGWYVSAVSISWIVRDPESGVKKTRGCNTRRFRADTTGVVVTCSATNGANLSGSYRASVKIDKTPPVARAARNRPPDFKGWYTRKVTVVFSGRDATSGLASCSPQLPYAGPDTAARKLRGTCRDRAGNRSSATVALKYDATPPGVRRALPGRRPDLHGWYNRPVAFRFAGADATSGIASCSRVTYRGPNSERASVAGTCRDNAGNASAPRAFALRYSRPLLRPTWGKNVTLPVVLDWVNVARARLYNIQVWKGRRKILSAWPSASSYRLARSWTFAGERYTLERATRYRWYVWPKLRGRYGRLLGRGTFDVVRGVTR